MGCFTKGGRRMLDLVGGCDGMGRDGGNYLRYVVCIYSSSVNVSNVPEYPFPADIHRIHIMATRSILPSQHALILQAPLPLPN